MLEDGACDGAVSYVAESNVSIEEATYPHAPSYVHLPGSS